MLDVGIWASTFQNASIDMNGDSIPDIEFLPPEVCSGPATNSPCTDLAGGASDQDPSYFGIDGQGNVHNSFSDPYNSFWRNIMDHIEDSEGNEDAVRFDADYSFPDADWLKSIRGGVRFANRENDARFSTYNWGVLSEIWGGRGPVWLDDPVDGTPGGTGGAPTSGAAAPFDFPGFMRGDAGDPQIGDPRLFYSGDPVGIMTSSRRLDCWLVTNGVRASSMAARKTGCLSLNVAVSSKALHSCRARSTRSRRRTRRSTRWRAMTMSSTTA